MNPIFILLGLLGATAFTRSSSDSSGTTDPLTVMGLSVEPEDEDEDEDNTNTGNAVVVGTTAGSYDAVVETPVEPVTVSDDTAQDEPEDEPTVPDETSGGNDGQPDLPAGFEIIFDDLVVADDVTEDATDNGDGAENGGEGTVSEAADEPVEVTEDVAENAEETPADEQEPAAASEEDPVETVEETVEVDAPAEDQADSQPEEEAVAEDSPNVGSSSGSAPATVDSGPLSLQGFSSDAFSDDLDAPIVLQFNQDIQLGDGDIELRLYNANGYETVERIGSNGLEVSGNQLLISPRDGLDPLRDYAINIEQGAVETKGGEPFEGFSNDTFSFTSGIGIEEPTINFADYDTIIDGETFNETLFLDSGDSKTLIINSTFENISGTGIMMRNVENVTIANSTFRNIDDFGILLRSSGSTDSITITGNKFEDLGGDAIHAAQRVSDDVDHSNLIVHDNDVHDVGGKGVQFHGIYVQASEAVVWGNDLTGTVGGNGISVRSDGIVYDNYVDVTSERDYGAGIKYFSDHAAGDTKTLVFADNVVEGNNLHAGIRLEQSSNNQPSNVPDEDWVVNDYFFLRNDVGGRNDYVIESSIENAPWATIEFIEDAPASTQSFSVAAMLPDLPIEEMPVNDMDQDVFEDALVF